jgi:hypothetical protein
MESKHATLSLNTRQLLLAQIDTRPRDRNPDSRRASPHCVYVPGPTEHITTDELEMLAAFTARQDAHWSRYSLLKKRFDDDFNFIRLNKTPSGYWQAKRHSWHRPETTATLGESLTLFDYELVRVDWYAAMQGDRAPRKVRAIGNLTYHLTGNLSAAKKDLWLVAPSYDSLSAYLTAWQRRPREPG